MLPTVPILLALVAAGAPAWGYVGPGAGFAFVSTAFVFVAALGLAITALLAWPIRSLVRRLRGVRRARVPGVRRVVVLGFDGQDAGLTEQFLAEGILPNFSRLRSQGCFARLATTLPASSPVAWSSFMTGCNPGKHRIFDFLSPNRRTLLPELSSARVTPAARTLRLGRYRLPLSGPRVASLRGSRPFWSILGEHGVFSTVLRVPLTFPPEKFNGLLLSASSVPDLKGSQGTYARYSSGGSGSPALKSGLELPLTIRDNIARGVISGPTNTLVEGGGELEMPFRILLPSHDEEDATLEIGGMKHPLRVGRYTPWIKIVFRPAPWVRVRGICRFLLLQPAPGLRLYMTPLQIDPENPALPLSHPPAYAVYLAKSQGPFATLGVAEDATAFNEGVIGERDFLEQCRLVHEEREKMFFDALGKTGDGALVCVFDLLDRVQHMCFRELGAGEGRPVREAYAAMDSLLGRVLDGLDSATVLMVLSDHGFRSFRRAVDLNAWLREEGLLTVDTGADGADLLRSVDWSHTRAYSVGFGGIYLNLRGREAFGIVEPGEAAGLKRLISERLLALRDGAESDAAVEEVFDRDRAYHGPYVEEAPDLIAGFRDGYRASWTSVTGGVGSRVFEANLRPWNGDHNVHPSLVPGVFLCNRAVERRDLRIEDVAPTILQLFGVPVPPHMDGRPFSLAGIPGAGA